MLDLFLMSRQAMKFLPIAGLLAKRGWAGVRPTRRSLVLNAGNIVFESMKSSTLGFWH
jgi:hypothetical protein